MHPSRYLPRTLPESLTGLADLAMDMRWSWDREAEGLWRSIDEDMWDTTGNPWFILESVSQKRLEELSRDKDFLAEIETQLKRMKEASHEKAWFQDAYPNSSLSSVAYFSMEFGLSEALPIYSGGLGILAGDHLKTANDLGLPLYGIGLLYQQGYFRQAIDAYGNQLEFYPYNDPVLLPVMPLLNEQGDWILINVELPGRSLILKTWEVKIGRIRLFLLDSNDPRNAPQDRGITSKLYGGGEEMRLQQEIVLGIGGWRLVELLGLNCNVCHLNEGHAAFAALERIKSFMKLTGVTFKVALNCVRAGNCFTTHTPVDAAFDRYPASMFEPYAKLYAKEMGIDPFEIMALGRANAQNRDEPFNMAYLALRCSLFINGVSRLHGKVSRRIFSPLFPRWPVYEIPVSHVTNAVHVPSWESKNADRLWSKQCGHDRWLGTLESIKPMIEGIEDEELWEFRSKGRLELIEFVRKRLKWQAQASGLELGSLDELLDPNALTLGFARRFTAYKRPALLLTDEERLARILNLPGRPVQLIIAGKAHPMDEIGKEMIRRWYAFLKRKDVLGKVIFIQDYDMIVAKKLVQGVDVWINNPRRPWEASGTSGMKVLVNGGLNISELDGWWAEAFDPQVGWSIGDGKEHSDDPFWDEKEAMELYDKLENEIIPTFYERDEHGIPRKWVSLMKASMSRLTPEFSSNRMLREYVEKFYIPSSEAFEKRARENGGLAKEITKWQELLDRHWKNIYFGNFEVKEGDGEYTVLLQVYLDDLPPDVVRVELFAEPLKEDEKPEVVQMEPKEVLKGAINGFLYVARLKKRRPISHFTPRIIPKNELSRVPLESSHILWFK